MNNTINDKINYNINLFYMNKKFMNASKDIFIVGLIMLVIDTIYLKFIAADPFMRMVENIQNSKKNIDFIAAALVYLLMTGGEYYFIIKDKRTPMDAFLLGILIYGVFDLTNKAVFTKYKWNIAIQDMFWGGVLFYTTTFIFYKITI